MKRNVTLAVLLAVLTLTGCTGEAPAAQSGGKLESMAAYPPTLQMKKGDQNVIQVVLTPEDAEDSALLWVSSNRAVATVNEKAVSPTGGVSIRNMALVQGTDADGEPVEVPADADEVFARWNYTSGAELLALCEREGATIAEAFRAREEALCAKQGASADIDAYLDRVLAVMDTAATTPITAPERSIGGLIGGEAAKVTESLNGDDKKRHLMDPLTAQAAIYALATLETNAKMGIIVATPTAGSSGVLPGVLLAMRDVRGYSHDELREGILTAAAVGYIVARNASVSGAEGGCQAEVGSAAAMAAAAAVAMAGGTPTQALDAASNVIQCLLGLVCDPVGGLVELPCQKRDATAAPVALVCAQIALAGVENLVPFDENVAVMDKVGRELPMELRETARGGIATAPSACSFCAGC